MLLTLTGVVFVAGYIYLRYAYRVTDSVPFTNEIVIIVLGTVATVLITALLLNQQTAVEIEKEQSLKFMDLKVRTYEDLIRAVEDMTLAIDLTREDVVRFQFLTHRLAICSSPPVLEEFQRFLSVLISRAADQRIAGSDSRHLAERLANLTVRIRADLMGDLGESRAFTHAEIKRQILENSSESMDLIGLESTGEPSSSEAAPTSS